MPKRTQLTDPERQQRVPPTARLFSRPSQFILAARAWAGWLDRLGTGANEVVIGANLPSPPAPGSHQIPAHQSNLPCPGIGPQSP
jgi:hypothetical protein